MLRSSTYFPRRFDQRLQAWCSLGREGIRGACAMVLEAYATTEAVCALTAEDTDEMDALLAAMARAGRSTDEQWSRLNRTWHIQIQEPRRGAR